MEKMFLGPGVVFLLLFLFFGVVFVFLIFFCSIMVDHQRKVAGKVTVCTCLYLSAPYQVL